MLGLRDFYFVLFLLFAILLFLLFAILLFCQVGRYFEFSVFCGGLVFGYGACFLEREVVVGGGFRALRAPRLALCLVRCAPWTLRLAWCLEFVGLARVCP
jgi:hypothetical protein